MNEERTVVLLGSTGSGKSTLGNRLASFSVFQEGHNLESQTRASESYKVSFSRYSVTMIDTQGFGENGRRSPKEAIQQSLTLIKDLEGGFHKILFCVEPRSRFDQNDLNILTKLGLIFGDDVYKHVHFVITQLDTLTDTRKLEIQAIYRNHLAKILEIKRYSFVAKYPILFSDFQNFSAFEQGLSQILEDDSRFIPQTSNLDFNKPLENLTNPLFQEFFASWKETLEEAGDCEHQSIEEKRLMIERKSFLEVAKILSDKNNMSVVDILQRFNDSGYQPFKDLANLYLCQGIEQNSTLIKQAPLSLKILVLRNYTHRHHDSETKRYFTQKLSSSISMILTPQSSIRVPESLTGPAETSDEAVGNPISAAIALLISLIISATFYAGRGDRILLSLYKEWLKEDETKQVLVQMLERYFSQQFKELFE